MSVAMASIHVITKPIAAYWSRDVQLMWSLVSHLIPISIIALKHITKTCQQFVCVVMRVKLNALRNSLLYAAGNLSKS